MENEGVRFRVWAPKARSIELIVEPPSPTLPPMALEPSRDGFFTGHFSEIAAGTLYRYRIDRDRCLPDPASRFQPRGVHGPSQVVNPSRFRWTDSHWRGLDLCDLILYELHVGTFSPEGTFSGVRRRLETLKELGITAVELMPVAEFPGNRNWGYDGVDLFAPTRCYGVPDALRGLIDRAHALGIGVFLDVVYNHLGPEGAYLGAFSPYYFSGKHKSPWGDAVNLDGAHSRHVRDFFIENALHWVHEYHIDGLRLDATHALFDDSPIPFLKELADRVRTSLPEGRKVLIIAEDDRNHAPLILPAKKGGYGLDAVWADDFHHQIRTLLAGDNDGYFLDFRGDAEDLAATLRQGWFYTGQVSAFRKKPWGTPARGIPLQRFVHCIQNHDQVGNRALGDRLHFKVDLASYRAASALLLFSPATPLLFMGQEWAAGSPFRYFTDHPRELGKRVTEGRRNEFRGFKEFSGPKARNLIPDPQALATFLDSRLDWEEPMREPHAGILRLYRTLLEMRRTEPALQARKNSTFDAAAAGRNTLGLSRGDPASGRLLMVACLKGPARIILGTVPSTRPLPGGNWKVSWHTEEDRFATAPAPPICTGNGETMVLEFRGPCAVILRSLPLPQASPSHSKT